MSKLKKICLYYMHVYSGTKISEVGIMTNTLISVKMLGQLSIFQFKYVQYSMFNRVVTVYLIFSFLSLKYCVSCLARSYSEGRWRAVVVWGTSCYAPGRWAARRRQRSSRVGGNPWVPPGQNRSRCHGTPGRVS